MALSCLCFAAACGGGQDKRAEMAPASSWDMDAEAKTEQSAYVEEPAADAAPRTESIELTTVSVQIEHSLAQHCGVALPNAFFDFDSAEIRPRGSMMLDRLATCLASDALRDRKLRITGHADPRGADEYNQKLGRSRAESVVEYLVQQGIARDRLEIASAGEQNATGSREDYPIERRVDIRLVESISQSD
jgi:peptidoglycan-associated lipoprotein